MIRLAMDIDGVLADFVGAVVPMVNRLWPGKLPLDYQPTQYDFGDVLTRKEWHEVWHTIVGTENFWLRLRPYQDSVRALVRFLVYNQGVVMYFVTSRGTVAGMTTDVQTFEWLDRLLLHSYVNYWGVVVVERPDDKAKACRALGLPYLLDDSPDVISCCEGTPVHGILLTRPWNVNAKPRDYHSWIGEYDRVASVEEYLGKVKAAS